MEFISFWDAVTGISPMACRGSPRIRILLAVGRTPVREIRVGGSHVFGGVGNGSRRRALRSLCSVLLMGNLPRSVESFLATLIRIPSVNPEYAGDRPDLAGEGRMVDYLAALAARAGLRIKRQRVARGRENLIVTLPSRGRRRHRLLFAPHLDTIGADASMLRGVRKGDRLFGRGACDTKGCVAAMFFVLLQLAKDPDRPKGLEVTFVGLADEEHAQLGSRAFAGTCPSFDLALVGEPTRLQVVSAHKGDFWFELETKGRAAHGSRPELGRNAVKRMADLVVALETTYADALREHRHPLLGHATINVGVISGGAQPNVVPDRCRIHVDRRTLPGESLRGVEREIRAVARKLGFSVGIRDLRQRPTPALETHPELPIVQQFLRATGQRETRGVDFFCDAAIIAQAGVPCLVFGPGDIAQAHTANEWISLTSLRRGTRLLDRFLRSFS